MSYAKMINSLAEWMSYGIKHPIVKGWCPFHWVHSVKMQTSSAYHMIIDTWWKWHQSNLGESSPRDLRELNQSTELFFAYENLNIWFSGEYQRLVNPDIAKWLNDNFLWNSFAELRRTLFYKYIKSIRNWWDSLSGNDEHLWGNIEFLKDHPWSSADKHNRFPPLFQVLLAIHQSLEAYFSLIIASEKSLGGTVMGKNLDKIRDFLVKFFLFHSSHHNIIGGNSFSLLDDVVILLDDSWNISHIDIWPKELSIASMELINIHRFIESYQDIPLLRDNLELLMQKEDISDEDSNFLSSVLRVVILQLHGMERIWCPALYVKDEATSKTIIQILLLEVIEHAEESYLKTASYRN